MSFLKSMKFERVDGLPEYAFEPISKGMVSLRAKGEDVINLGMGNPDQPTPQAIVEKLQETSRRGDTHRYSVSRGIHRLRTALCDWYERHHNVILHPDTQSLVTMGSKEGLAHLGMSVFSQGDLVLVPSPCYPVHAWGAIIAGADIRYLHMESASQLLDEIVLSIENSWPKPKAIILNFPANPTGFCVDIDFFEEVVKLAKKHEIFIIHDFAYADLGFDGYRPPSFLQAKGAIDVGVEFYSLSKSFNMAGWRVGFCVGNEYLIKALTRIKSYLDYGLFTPIQVAGVMALDEGDEWAKDVAKVYQNRCHVLVDSLQQAGWDVNMPKATMFVWAKLPEHLKKLGSVQASLKLLEEAKVAVTPGTGFGPYGEGYVRFSLIENEQRIRQAVRGIKSLK